MSSFKEIINSVVNFPELFTVGTVDAVDEATYSCDVQPEDGGTLIKDVPLRVRRDNNKVGVTIVPALDTPIIIMWIDTQRPTVFQVQEWAKIIIQDASGLGFVITAADRIRGGIEGRATHGVGWGDIIKAHLEADKAWKDAHTHGLGPGPDTNSPTVPDMESEEFFTS